MPRGGNSDQRCHPGAHVGAPATVVCHGINAPAFLSLPPQVKGQPFALIYADQSSPGAIVVDDKVLGLFRTLSNQAVMEFRQAG